MSFPAQPNWKLATVHSAWVTWTHPNGDPYVCETEGYRYVRYMQNVLKAALAAGGQNDYAGRLIRPSQINADGTWGPLTTRALSAILMTLNAPSALTEAVASMDRQSTTNKDALRASVWMLLHYARIEVDPATIVVPDNTILPAFDRPLPVPSGYAENQPVFDCRINAPQQPSDQQPPANTDARTEPGHVATAAYQHVDDSTQPSSSQPQTSPQTTPQPQGSVGIVVPAVQSQLDASVRNRNLAIAGGVVAVVGVGLGIAAYVVKHYRRKGRR